MTVRHIPRMEQKDRLMQAIREAGFEKPTDAWRANQRALGISQDLMISNCNGNRPISKPAATRYAAVFGRTPGWYLFGDAETGATSPKLKVSVSPAFPVVRVGDKKSLRKLLNQIDGLKPRDTRILLSAIEGMQRTNGALSESSVPHDQPAPANLPHE